MPRPGAATRRRPQHISLCDAAGDARPLQDPIASELRLCVQRANQAAAAGANPTAQAQRRAQSMLSIQQVFGALGADQVFVAAVAGASLALLRDGVAGVIAGA